MADKNELIDVCTDLIRIVEGVGCKDWRDQNGQRFKDTNEWVRAYVAINNARKESREKSTPPADAALADRVTPSLIIHYGQVQQENEKLREEIAALRARAVPVCWPLVYADSALDYILENHPNVYAECGDDEKFRAERKAMLAASKGGAA